jgi:hypothetical protein
MELPIQPTEGAVARSINSISTNASRRDPPQVSLFGAKLEQIGGLSGFPNNPHRLSSVKLTHLTPAGLPLGMPGMADEIEMAMQQAPQFIRQFMIGS